MPQTHQNYPLTIRDCGLATAFSLMQRSLPYAMMRFVILVVWSLAAFLWLVVTIGGALWSAAHIAEAFGIIWFLTCIAAGGWFWHTVLRYALHLIECGHVAVLTELITHGDIDNRGESMIAYGRRIVTERFGEVNLLFAANMMVRGIVGTINGIVEGISSSLPIPGLDTVAHLFAMVTRAATRYLDKVIFSYNLARTDDNPWGGARDGLVYYAQNARPILKQALWIVILDTVLSACTWLVTLAPAALLILLLPQSIRSMGAVPILLLAVLFASAARNAFIKPVFLVMVMVRFHALVKNRDVNREWTSRLDRLSDKFRDLGRKAAGSFNPSLQPAR